MNNLLAVLIVLGAQLGAHSSAVLCGVTLPREPQAQDAGPDAGPDAAPTDSALPGEIPDDVDASVSPVLALMEKAARFQRGDTIRGRPSGLHGLFQVHVKNVSDGSAIDASVERIYLRDPVRMVTTRQDNLVNSDSTVGFDGERTWFRDNATGTVRVYSDDPLTFEVDLEQMREQLRLMPMMLDAFVLDALLPRLQGLRLDGGVVEMPVGSRGRETVNVQWVVGRMEDELFDPEPGSPPRPGSVRPPPPELQIGLAIEPDTGKLWTFRVRTLGRSEPRELELRFYFHRDAGSGLTVPAFTAVHQDGEEEPFITLGMIPAPDDDGLVFELDPVVEADIFAVPDA